MPVIMSGSKTILDLTDSGSLSVYLASNLPKSQVYDVEAGTYSPSWVSTHLVITPSVFLDQQSISRTDSKLSYSWKRREGSGAIGNLASGESVSGGVLTVSANKLDGVASGLITYILTVTYTNSTTGVTTTATEEVTYQLVRSGGVSGEDAFMLSLYSPKGTVFTNGMADGTASITVYTQFFKGATDITNDTNSYYLWQKYVNGSWVQAKAEARGTSGNTLTVNASDITASMNYRCRARYGSSSTTYYYETITIIDKTDSYQASVTSTIGDVLKNGSGDGILFCRVWQNGAEVDPLKSTTYQATDPTAQTAGAFYYRTSNSTPNTSLMRYDGTNWINVTNDPTYMHTLNYTWRRLDINGDMYPDDVSTPFATGKVIHITGDDVDGYATFVCEVDVPNDDPNVKDVVAGAQFTIRDDNDIIVSNVAPENPYAGQLWLDTNVNQLKRWNGEIWVTVNDTTAMYNELTGSIQQAKTDLTSYVDTKTSQMTLSDSEFETIFTRTVRNSIFGEGVSQQDQKSINDVMNSLDNYKTDVSVYMRYDNTGTLTLGNQGDNFRTQITNQKMSFMEGSSEVASISNNSLFITNARVTDTLSVGTEQDGYFDWTVTATGLGLKWRNR